MVLIDGLLCKKSAFEMLKGVEIGIGDNPRHPTVDNGGSIKLWHDFFLNATVYALDIKKPQEVWDEIKNVERIILHIDADAYDEIKFKTDFLDKNIKFDFMLDDGPHTLKSMIQFINLYSQLMMDDGILIIEDVQSWDWIEKLKKATPEHLKEYIETYDLRSIKGRHDDIVFVVNKSGKK